jgi:hypothetical protein
LPLPRLFYSFFDIAVNSGWSTVGTAQGLIYFDMAMAYALALEIIASIPGVGWFLALGVVISDLIGNWFSDLLEDLWDVLYDMDIRSEPIIEVNNPSFGFDDYDDNGMTAGELAKMFNGQGWLAGGVKAELVVVPMEAGAAGCGTSRPVCVSLKHRQ